MRPCTGLSVYFEYIIISERGSIMPPKVTVKLVLEEPELQGALVLAGGGRLRFVK